MSDNAETARRNIALLAGAQAIGGSVPAVVMSIGALTGVLLAPDPSLATLPITSMIVGQALIAGPAALLLHRLGRRTGFMLANALAVVAGIAATVAVVMASFWLFCAAIVGIGIANAFAAQYRFAAADSVPEALKGRAISWVMAGGVFAGFIGPLSATLLKDVIPGAEFAGSFLAVAGLSLITIGIIAAARLAPGVRRGDGPRLGRPLGVLLRAPTVFTPVIAGAVSYTLMTFVMVAAPLAMVYVCGHATSDATTAIQWHIVAMFAPSFVTGMIIARIGAGPTAGIGLVLILCCALINLNGTSVLHFDLSLILLGIGWNFGFIGSTALLASSYRPEEAGRVQALNEQIVFGAMALASIGSGVLLNAIGWEAINILVMPVVAFGLIVLGWNDLTRRRQPA